MLFVAEDAYLTVYLWPLAKIRCPELYLVCRMVIKRHSIWYFNQSGGILGYAADSVLLTLHKKYKEPIKIIVGFDSSRIMHITHSSLYLRVFGMM